METFYKENNMARENFEGLKIDYFVDFFQRGLHHILERILQNMTLESLLACRKASPEWCQIVNQYMNELENPKQYQARLDAEWKRKDPLIVKCQILKIRSLQCDMIADGKHIVIVPSGTPGNFTFISTLKLWGARGYKQDPPRSNNFFFN